MPLPGEILTQLETASVASGRIFVDFIVQLSKFDICHKIKLMMNSSRSRQLNLTRN